LSEIVGLLLLIRYQLGVGPEDGRLLGLLYACRRIDNRSLRTWLARELRPWLTTSQAPALRSGRLGAALRQRDVSKTALYKSLLIKEPGPHGEKGVLYMAGEDNLARLLVHHDARRFLAEYLLVGASSSSPADFGLLAGFAGLSDDPLFIGISNPADTEAYAVLHPTVAALPVMACDWINPGYYSPRPQEHRAIDILMVANFLPVKRHWLLFQALRDMRADLRVVLIGIRTPTRGEAELRAEARAFGARQELEILTNASIDTVTAYQCNARISVILTQREGSCVAVTESFFADTPVAMMRGCHVGSRAYINDHTGVLLAPRRLAYQLSAFLERSAEFRPRQWAMEHITCFHTSARVNATLRDHCLGRGQPWTRDIRPMCRRYVASYVNSADERELKPALDQLRERHGIDLERFVYRDPAAR
jgi:hypothetical protein